MAKAVDVARTINEAIAKALSGVGGVGDVSDIDQTNRREHREERTMKSMVFCTNGITMFSSEEPHDMIDRWRLSRDLDALFEGVAPSGQPWAVDVKIILAITAVSRDADESDATFVPRQSGRLA